MPTTTRSGIFGREHVEPELTPGKVVVHAALYQRGAMLAASRGELLAREPVQRQDLLVERTLLHAFDAAAEAIAQEGDIRRRVVPAIDADQRSRLEAVRGLFEHLAPARRHERLVRVQMPRRLVQHPPSVDLLLDEKKTPILLDDGGHRGRRPPYHQAAFWVFLRMNSAMRATPASIACFDAAYEKRTCWPSPGTRMPKWMSASSATPASLSRRLRKSSESRAPIMRQASVTFGQT